MPNPHIPQTHTPTHYVYIKRNHPLSPLFFSCVVRYSPNPLRFASLSVILIRIIIHTQASAAQASASPSVDLPLPPPLFFFFTFPSSSPPPLKYTFRFLSHPRLLQLLSLCSSHFLTASFPFISRITVFTNCNHSLHILQKGK